ncbi:MAG: double-cubane-cluster-containing anaerobic reductase [Peptostreptococcaceae bacterium]
MVSLPEQFEEFGEARRNGFIKVKELKEQGKNVAGVFCAYTPVEIPLAAGLATVTVCGISEEPIKDAEKILPRNLCPLIKSSFGHAITDTCPYIYFSDLLIAETTCDGKKKMYEELGKIKELHLMNLPNSKESEFAYKLWKNELVLLKESIEKKFNVAITDDKLKEAIKDKNEERKLIKEFYSLSKMTPPPISGYDMHTVLQNIGFKFDRVELKKEMRELIDSIKEKYENGERPIKKDKPRILITGCPIGGVAEKVIKTIEDSGAVVVAFENCGGIKSNYELVDEENNDLIDAIARKYINIPCSCMSNNVGRIKLIGEIIDEYKIDGVVDVILQACHTFNVESYQIKNYANKEKNTPYMSIETDYSKSDIEQLRTRFEAFVEMLDREDEKCTV